MYHCVFQNLALGLTVVFLVPAWMVYVSVNRDSRDQDVYVCIQLQHTCVKFMDILCSLLA